MICSARDADKVALLLKVWRQRLSYRSVCAEESKRRPLQRRQRESARLFRTSRQPPSPSRVWKPRWISP